MGTTEINIGNVVAQLATDVAAVTAAKADVRDGTQIIGAVAGTCAVPTASQVLNGIDVDATAGNVTLPGAATLTRGVQCGVNGTSITGTYDDPDVEIAQDDDGYWFFHDATVLNLTLLRGAWAYVVGNIGTMNYTGGAFDSGTSLNVDGGSINKIVVEDLPGWDILDDGGSGSLGLTELAINCTLGDGCGISFTGNDFDVASVNGLMAALIAGGCTNATVDVSGGTSAAPSGQGITDKADAITAGCSVVTN